jgi:Mrp family chromosome partitioning ATPase
MKWGLAAAVASAATVAAASGAELLACDCDASAPSPAPAATVGRCDGLVLSRQHHDDEVPEVRLPRIEDSWVPLRPPLSCMARYII